MDLGIAGRTAIVCGASTGLGKACAQALAAEGSDVVLVARTASVLDETAEALRRTSGAKVTAVSADLTTSEGRAALLAACPATDILVTNLGNSRKGEILEWDEEAWSLAVDRHMIAPAMLMRAYVPGMGERGFGRVVNILSRAVRSPMEHLTLANAPRSGLAGFVGALARSVAPRNVTINNLLPGPFATETQAAGLVKLAELSNVPHADFVRNRAAEVPARRFGDPKEFGAYCAFLCGQDAGYVVGQNLLIDGGAVNLI